MSHPVERRETRYTLYTRRGVVRHWMHIVPSPEPAFGGWHGGMYTNDGGLTRQSLATMLRAWRRLTRKGYRIVVDRES